MDPEPPWASLCLQRATCYEPTASLCKPHLLSVIGLEGPVDITAQPQASHLTSQSLSFLICKMGRVDSPCPADPRGWGSSSTKLVAR